MRRAESVPSRHGRSRYLRVPRHPQRVLLESMGLKYDSDTRVYEPQSDTRVYEPE